MKMKLDAGLDKWWIQASFAETKKGGFKFTSFTTLDEKTAKWHRVMVDNMGGYETSESAGGANGKVDWEGTARSAMGTTKTKHHEEMVSPKEVKMWGEFSTDGKAWTKSYEAVCKK
jgi:hypothetical protein